MQWLRGNIGVDGHEYIKGFLGLDWFPSAEAKSNLQRYEGMVGCVLTKINKLASGFWVLKFINTVSSRKVVIKPWIPNPIPGHEEENKIKNPYAAFDDNTKATRQGDMYGTDLSPGSSTKTVWGVGGGTDVTVRFSPWMLPYGDKLPGYAPEELLLHELVHALNGVKGLYTPVGHGSEKNFDMPDEFMAIVLTNLYSSQLGRPLRKDHHGHLQLDKELCDSEAFYKRYPRAIQDICSDYGELVKIYAGWAPDFLPFNPFRFAKL
jgi:hypothetical protein